MMATIEDALEGAKKGDIDIVRAYLSTDGSDVNAYHEGMTLLFCAVMNNQIDVLNCLVNEFGASLNLSYDEEVFSDLGIIFPTNIFNLSVLGFLFFYITMS